MNKHQYRYYDDSKGIRHREQLCPLCHGSGKHPTLEGRKCTQCNGWAYIECRKGDSK